MILRPTLLFFLLPRDAIWANKSATCGASSKRDLNSEAALEPIAVNASKGPSVGRPPRTVRDECQCPRYSSLALWLQSIMFKRPVGPPSLPASLPAILEPPVSAIVPPPSRFSASFEPSLAPCPLAMLRLVCISSVACPSLPPSLSPFICRLHSRRLDSPSLARHLFSAPTSHGLTPGSLRLPASGNEFDTAGQTSNSYCVSGCNRDRSTTPSLQRFPCRSGVWIWLECTHHSPEWSRILSWGLF